MLLLVAAAALVALLIRPLTGRERRLPALITTLIGVQLLLRAVLLLASTGHFAHSGSTGLFCSPAAPGVNGLSCLPTERGGFVLLAVQVLGALALAGWLRDVEAASWNLARLFGHGVSRLTGTIAAVCVALVALAIRVLVTSPLTPAAPARDRRPITDARRLRLAAFSRTRGRRGPPAAADVRARSGSRSRAGLPGSTAFAPGQHAVLTAS